MNRLLDRAQSELVELEKNVAQTNQPEFATERSAAKMLSEGDLSQ